MRAGPALLFPPQAPHLGRDSELDPKRTEKAEAHKTKWDDMESIVSARPAMVGTLDSFRETLEDLGSGLGVTDPVSGPVVLGLK